MASPKIERLRESFEALIKIRIDLDEYPTGSLLENAVDELLTYEYQVAAPAASTILDGERLPAELIALLNEEVLESNRYWKAYCMPQNIKYDLAEHVELLDYAKLMDRIRGLVLSYLKSNG